jgi:hypothetical protein
MGLDERRLVFQSLVILVEFIVELRYYLLPLLELLHQILYFWFERRLYHFGNLI